MTIIYEFIMIATPILMFLFGVKYGKSKKEKIGDENISIGDVYTSKTDMDMTVVIINVGRDSDGDVYVEYTFSINGIYSYKRKLHNFKNDYTKIIWKKKK